MSIRDRGIRQAVETRRIGGQLGVFCLSSKELIQGSFRDTGSRCNLLNCHAAVFFQLDKPFKPHGKNLPVN